MERIPPFKPGDKVVRIGKSEAAFDMYQGHVYTVDEIEYCCNQRGWCISVVESPLNMSIYACDKCNRRSPLPWGARNFRKIDDLSDHTADSLLEELKEPVFAEPQTV